MDLFEYSGTKQGLWFIIGLSLRPNTVSMFIPRKTVKSAALFMKSCIMHLFALQCGQIENNKRVVEPES